MMMTSVSKPASILVVVSALGTATFAKFAIATDQPNAFQDFTAQLPELDDKENLYFLFDPVDGQSVSLDYFLVH